MSRIARRIIAASAALTLPLLFTLFSSPTAAALQQDVTCLGTATITFSPGLTYTTQTVTLSSTVSYSPCTSTDPTLTAGSQSVTHPASGNCLALPLAFSGISAITWNNGNTSTYSFNDTVTYVAGTIVATRTGTITAGQFPGDTLIRVLVFPAINPLDCLTTGLTSMIGTVTLSITSP